MNLRQAKTMEEARSIIRSIYIENLEGLEKIIKLSELIKNAIPKDATEDFFIGAQYSLFIIVELLQAGILRGLATEDTFADIGLAFLYYKQNEDSIFVDLNLFDDWIIEEEKIIKDTEKIRQFLKDEVKKYRERREEEDEEDF